MARPRGETNRRLTDEERQAKASVQQARDTRRGREQAKRRQLLEELGQLSKQPLADKPLPKTEIARIAERVRAGLSGQSMWPRSGSGRTSVGEL